MKRTVTLTAVTAALLLTLPAVGAEWLSYGSFEPDTNYDTSSLMWQQPPGATANRVYFNAYAKWGEGAANGAFVNPNVGAAKTRFDVAGPTTWHAILGVWADCNGDGYVGMAETAVREYKAELLTDTSVCKPQTGPRTSWMPGAHNYNGWVTELISVGGREYDPGDDKRVYADGEAMVWGDMLRPDSDWPVARACQVEPGAGANSIPAARSFLPLPGDSRSTGGIIRTIDCRGNRGIVDAFNEADGTLGLGLGFEDPANPQNSNSPLNVGTFGDDHSQHSAVYLQDCSAQPLANTGDVPAGNDLDNVDIIRPVPANPVNGDPSQWTVPGTLNATRESITVVWQQNNTAPPKSDDEGDCDYTNDNGHDFYGNIENNAGINIEGGKRDAQMNFAFRTASRGTLPATALGSGAAMAPTDFGVEALGIECTASSCVQTAWAAIGNPIYIPPVFRGTVTDGTLDGDETTLADAMYWSFYAYVGSATTGAGLVLPGGSGKYGSAQCGSFTSGSHHGWNCDASQWYLLADGTNSADGSARPLARVGQTYNLRDVDCYDGGAGETGLGISPAFFGNNPCA